MKFPSYPRYKPSGIEWLGDVPDHWEVKRLKIAAHLTDRKVEADEENPVPYIGLENIESWTGRLLPINPDMVPTGTANAFKAGHTLFGKLRPYLAKACTPDFDGLCSTEFLVLNGVEFDRDSLRYALLSDGFIKLVDSSTYGSKMPRASWDFIGNCVLPLAPPSEQHAIAAFLDRETGRMDRLVLKKRELIERLKEKRTALISRTVTRGLPPAAARAAGLPANPPLKPSGLDWLGDIPKHWEAVRLKHLLRRRKGAVKTGPFGSQLQSTEMMDGEVKVYNQRSVIDRDFDGGDNYISLEKFEELQAFEVFPDDLLVTTRGTIGRCAVLPDASERGILHPCLMRVQFDPRRVNNRFAEILIQDSGRVLEQLELKSNATTIDVIYSESLREIWFALPPLPEQIAIAAYLDAETAKLDALVGKVEEAVERLQEYRTALITAAVTGKIDVRKALA